MLFYYVRNKLNIHSQPLYHFTTSLTIVTHEKSIFIFVNRTLNSTFVQCVAGPRPMSGSGKVVFRIDNGEALSDDDFEYSDDPEVSFLVTRSVIKRYVATDFSVTFYMSFI